jgi:hypothetical protein
MAKIIRVLVALIGLVGAVPALAQRWKPYNELGDLYPAYAIAVSNLVPDADDQQDKTLLGDLNGVLGVTFTPARPNTRVTLEIRCDNSLKLFESARIEVVTPTVGEEYLIRPLIRFDHIKLASIRQPVTTHITYILTIDGHRQMPRTERLRVRSINDCPYAFVDENEQATPIDLMFAAYVNEDHPWIQSILEEALRKKYVAAFVGYQTDRTGVYRQVMAIWRVLQDRGIRYGSIPGVAPTASGVLSQHVRMLDESIRYAQSNCVDGTVLLASILRKIALNPILVVLPGHMFVGFDLDADGEQQAYLETTLLGGGTRKGEVVNSRLYETLLGTELNQNAQGATKSFVGAVESGNARFMRSKPGIRRRKDGYGLIDLAIARAAGIAPIMYIEPGGNGR